MYRISTIARARACPLSLVCGNFRAVPITSSLVFVHLKRERSGRWNVAFLFARFYPVARRRSTSRVRAQKRARQRKLRARTRRGPIRKRGTVSPCVTSSSCAEHVIVENSPSIKVLHAGLLSPERKTRERSDPCSLSQIPLHFLRILSPYLVLSPTDTRTRTYTYRETREKCAGALTARARRPFVCRDRRTVHITGLRSHVYTFRKVSLILV